MQREVAWTYDRGQPAEALPAALGDLHRVLAVGEVVRAPFSSWQPERLDDVFVGAGFGDLAVELGEPTFVTARRARTLADTVGPGMRLLLCGLNPSVVAADAGYGFAGPRNRFWKAALAAGVVTMQRDPRAALAADGVGMTDLVKRATPRSSEVTAAEYRAGAARVERLVSWLLPVAVCFVGLEGWRTAIDRRAVAGWQPAPFGGRPAYVMPSTSGLNASSSLDDLAGHLAAALTGPR